MSANATPISPERFAAALTDLSLASLHAKAAELHNSISHLLDSNAQLQEFAQSGDEDCAQAYDENLEVVGRYRERIDLLKREVVDVRGQRWVNVYGGGVAQASAADDTVESPLSHDLVNGTSGEDRDGIELGNEERGVSGVNVEHNISQSQSGQPQSGRLTDDELARRLRERLEQDGDDDDDDDPNGLHL